jgi:hypothetical protein
MQPAVATPVGVSPASVPTTPPSPQAQIAVPGVQATAQTVIINNYANPRAMCEQFWQLKKATLQQHGIQINE